MSGSFGYFGQQISCQKKIPDIFWCAVYFRYNSYDFKKQYIFCTLFFLIFSPLCMMTYHSNIFPPWFLSNPICLSWCFLFILESFCSLQLHDYSSATFPWVVNVWRDHFVIDSMASKPCVTCALSKRDDVHIRGIDQINIKIQKQITNLSLFSSSSSLILHWSTPKISRNFILCNFTKKFSLCQPRQSCCWKPITKNFG